MSHIQIKRLDQNSECTFGALSVDGNLICFTLELPYKNNKPNISCISIGKYKYEVYKSKRFNRDCIRILNVYNRTNIIIHPGNYITDTEGCIFPGMHIDKKDICNSRCALQLILEKLYYTGNITISNAF